jgi:hypothetical protein
VAEDIHWQQYASRFRTFDRLIVDEPMVKPELAICIPSYAEPDLIQTLESLVACPYPGIPMEVLILFNEDERMDEAQKEVHHQCYLSCKEWIHQREHLKFKFHPIWLAKMPDVKWGVGWARKMLMDEAARRMAADGIIVNLDADCTVAENYLGTIWDEFAKDSSMEAASIYTEHQLDHLHQPEKDAIIAYELHLRYLVHAKRWAGHPFAYQTFGSAMAVRRKAYLEQGGMNTRQAGEDFYFLQKFIEIGTLREIGGTAVYPSARKSLRVPFGTGKAMYQIHEEHLEWKTTSFESFRLIRPLLQQIPLMYSILLKRNNQKHEDIIYENLGLGHEVITFLQSIDFKSKCDSIALNTSSLASFERRFFRFFNAFMMIRYMHFMRDHFFPDTTILESFEKLVAANEWVQPAHRDNERYLNLFRMVDRNGIASIHLFG